MYSVSGYWTFLWSELSSISKGSVETGDKGPRLMYFHPGVYMWRSRKHEIIKEADGANMHISVGQ